jgi:hypothetical protein
MTTLEGKVVNNLAQVVIEHGRNVDPAIVEQIVRGSLSDGQVIDIKPINGEGVSNNAQLFLFHHSNGRLAQLVVKISQGIGIQERHGRQLLTPYLPLAEELGSPQADAFIYQFVPGLSVNCLISMGSQLAPKHYAEFIDLNTAMWRKTISQIPVAQLTGYATKVDSTVALLSNCVCTCGPLADLMDLPIVVNSRRLPTFGRFLESIRNLVCPQIESLGSLQHGDEGVVNFIVRDDDEVPFFIDNGNAGWRLLAEAIAKIALWWSISAEISSGKAAVENGRLCFEYQVSVSDRIRKIVAQSIRDMIDQFKPSLEPAQLAACFAVYCLRELQWTAKRRYPFLPETLLALALDVGAGMFGEKVGLPGFADLEV